MADQDTPDWCAALWRTGRKVGRTIYAQEHDSPSDTGPLIGVMDTPELAVEACRAHNNAAGARADERQRLSDRIFACQVAVQLPHVGGTTAAVLVSDLRAILLEDDPNA